MSFDYALVFETIEMHKRVSNASLFMKKVLSTCKKVEPNTAWNKFLELDYESESEKLSNHVASVLELEPVRFEVQGFWFGINNHGLENGETISNIYFSVSSVYEPEDADADWACSAEHYPDAKDFNSEIMAEIYRLAYSETGLGNKAEHPLCLAYGLKIAEKAMRNYRKSVAGHRVGYAVGFDSGDFINLGWV